MTFALAGCGGEKQAAVRAQRPCAITADTESKKPEKRVKDTPAEARFAASSRGGIWRTGKGERKEDQYS